MQFEFMRTERSAVPGVVALKPVSKTFVKLPSGTWQRLREPCPSVQHFSGGGAAAEGRAITWTCCCIHRQAEQAQHVPSDAREEQQDKRTSACIRSTSYQSVQTGQEGAIRPC